MPSSDSNQSGNSKPVKGQWFRRIRVPLILIVAVAVITFAALPLLFDLHVIDDESSVQAQSITSEPSTSPTPTPNPSTPTGAALQSPEPTASVVAQDPYAHLDTSGYTLLQLEDDDEAVSAIQQRLMELGYFDYDQVTTYYGTVTQAAVSRFQRALGWEPDGISTARLQAVLFSAEAPAYTLQRDFSGSDIRRMQARLQELGYEIEKVNGYFGVATERAVNAFARRNNLAQNGVMDAKALQLLYSPNARYLVDPTPTPTVPPTPTPKPTAKPTATPKPTKTPKPTATPKPNVPSPAVSIPPLTQTIVPTTPVPTTPTPPTANIVPTSGGAEAYIQVALAQLGKPYEWSEEGPDSFDCSGLVYYSLRQAGISTSRYSAAGFSQVSSWQTITSMSDLQRGDLLFYKSDTVSTVNHTGIYLGNGQFVHASSSSGKVILDRTTGYYQRNFVVAKRIYY